MTPATSPSPAALGSPAPAPAPAKDVVRGAVAARLFWWLSRWQMSPGELPPGGRGIILGAPHTSNWDFVLMLAVTRAAGTRLKWLGKHTVFRGVIGRAARALGGIPVDRRAPHGLVNAVIEMIATSEPFYLLIAPEGTRRGNGWKSGFYRIALATGLPVTLAFVDRTTMTSGYGPTLTMTGDVTADMDQIRAFYADKAGFKPGRRTEPRLLAESAGADTLESAGAVEDGERAEGAAGESSDEPDGGPSTPRS